MIYLNSVYDFPFSKTHDVSIDVLDIQGNPHMESCDPGIFPSYFFDFGKAKARKAWLDILQDSIVNGSADGVYIDCYSTMGLKCDDKNETCIAKRNGKVQSVNEEVTF